MPVDVRAGLAGAGLGEERIRGRGGTEEIGDVEGRGEAVSARRIVAEARRISTGSVALAREDSRAERMAFRRRRATCSRWNAIHAAMSGRVRKA